MKDYLQESKRTESLETKTDEAPIHYVLDNLGRLVCVGFDSDLMKRNIFYRLPIAELKEKKELYREVIEGYKTRVEAIPSDEAFDDTKIDLDILHGILGIQSEVGELAEAMLDKALSGMPIDNTNLAEECGDIMWYLAILVRKAGVSFDQIARANIAKLAARYPEKFTTEGAVDRDLKKEREQLELNLNPKEGE